MKTYKLFSILAITLLVAACSSSSNSSSGNCQECAYSKTSSETAGTVAASLNGTHNLTFDFAQTGSPLANGTKAKFIIDNNTLTVEIDGKSCIVLKNPIETSPFEVTFKDNCRDNLSYAVSTNQSGGLNEINVLSISNTFYGQFK